MKSAGGWERIGEGVWENGKFEEHKGEEWWRGRERERKEIGAVGGRKAREGWDEGCNTNTPLLVFYHSLSLKILINQNLKRLIINIRGHECMRVFQDRLINASDR